MKLLMLFLIFSIASLSVHAGNNNASKNTALSDAENLKTIAEGGRLYDKWWKELKLNKPKTTHPSYPATGKKQGSASWRCKECHGWDYKGAAGAYGKNNHYTGIKGISQANNKNINEIITILKNKNHNFNNVIPDSALVKIASFVKYGQIDITEYLINKKTKRVNGNFKQGKKIFFNTCVECHGNDGRAINFRTSKKPEYVGTVAQENPWEAIHKIRYGQPGTSMPNMNKKLDLNAQIDLLTYMQSLPVK